MREQLPDTATAVVSKADWRRPGNETRRRPLPPSRDTKASILPLVSPRTRFDAADRNATHLGRARNEPSTAGAHDGPLAGAPMPRETRIVEPGNHCVPSLPKTPSRRTTKTSLTPLASPATRFEASDWNAIARAQRRSLEITAFVEGPFGRPPSDAREMRIVFWADSRADSACAAGAAAASATSAPASARRGLRRVITLR